MADLDNRYLINSLPQQNDLRSIAYGGDTLIAVGDKGTVLTSRDGITWEDHSDAAFGDLYGIAYGNSTFMAVSAGGKVVTSSDDGASWKDCFFDDLCHFWGVAYGSGNFVVAGAAEFYGDEGIIIPLNNCHPIQYLHSTTSISIRGIASDNETVIAVGRADGMVIVSDDGGTMWRSLPSKMQDGFINGMGYGNNIFVAVGGLKSGGIYTSTDKGWNWKLSVDKLPYVLNGVSYGDGIFIAVGEKGMLYASADGGGSWQPRFLGTNNTLYQAAYDGKSFYVVGEKGTILRLGSIFNSKPGRGIDLNTVLSLLNYHIDI